jgi:hypothetical protein
MRRGSGGEREQEDEPHEQPLHRAPG